MNPEMMSKLAAIMQRKSPEEVNAAGRPKDEGKVVESSIIEGNIPERPAAKIKKKKPSRKPLVVDENEEKKIDLTLDEDDPALQRRPTRRVLNVPAASPNASQGQTSKKVEEVKPKPKDTANQALKYYFCPNCKEVPRITMTKETAISVQCRCKKETVPQIMNLSAFLSEVDKPKDIPNCSIENKHSSPVKSTKYCPQCKKFFCEQCLADHDNFQQHISINCNGMIINSTCENEGCKTKDPIEFYCSNCKVHLCAKCKADHKKKHQISDLYEIVNDGYFSELEETIAEIEENMATETQFYNEVLDLEKMIQNCKKLVSKRMEENEGIIKYFKSLINTYKNTRGIMNYNIRQNGISSDIRKIYSFSKVHFRFKLKSEIVQTKLFKFLNQTKNYFNINAEYDIKSKEEVKQINKDLKEKDILKDYPDYYRILGYDMDKKTDFIELNQDNCIMLVDDVIVPFSPKFNPNTPPGKHKVEIITKVPTNTITSLKSLFEGCKSLTAADLSNFDSVNVIDMKGMFCWCHSLTSLNLKNLDTGNTTDMKGMFVKCKSLSSLDLSYFDTNKVTDMKYMFFGCKNLTSLNLSNFITTQVKDMKNMFYDCSALTELDLFNFETPLVEEMKQMFYGCFNLVSLDLSNFDTANVYDMDEMFCNCAVLSDLKINVESKVKKLKDIFYNCNKLDQGTKDKFKKKGFFG
ncbi:MAG: BspA family leucine-rich repeat surface protein [archaeon]|nr:BspA family leucine-rich repeat surface protein [archaeon]